MADEPRLKGVAFRSVYTSLGKLRGVAAQQTLLAGSSAELRDRFTEVLESRSGYSHARWTDCYLFDENMWTEILGSSVQLLEIGGAKNVRARIVEGCQDGDETMEAGAHWS